MGEVWEGRSYTKEDVESAIEKVARIPKMTRGAAESEVYNLLEYSMPPEEAVCALYQSNNASHLLEEDYESFSNWDSELPPPKVTSSSP